MEDLPHDMIVEICEKSDISTLGTLMRTSTRNYEICNEVIDKRIDAEINYINKQLKKWRPPVYVLGKYTIKFDMDMGNGNLIITESKEILSKPKYLPQNLPNATYLYLPQNDGGNRVYNIHKNYVYAYKHVEVGFGRDEMNLREIVKILLSNGFKRSHEQPEIYPPDSDYYY